MPPTFNIATRQGVGRALGARQVPCVVEVRPFPQSRQSSTTSRCFNACRGVNCHGAGSDACAALVFPVRVGFKHSCSGDSAARDGIPRIALSTSSPQPYRSILQRRDRKQSVCFDSCNFAATKKLLWSVASRLSVLGFHWHQ